MIGLTTEEKARLILSVGRGGAGGVRPLSPVQVAALLKKCLENGDTQAQLATELTVGQDMIVRFLLLDDLADDVKSAVEWRGSPTTLSFSAGYSIAGLKDATSQKQLAQAVIAEGLSAASVRQVLQRMRRGQVDLKTALSDILVLRPEMQRQHVTIGAVTDSSIRAELRDKPDYERNELLQFVLRRLLPGSTYRARLTETGFTISTDAPGNALLLALTPDFETAINQQLAEALK